MCTLSITKSMFGWLNKSMSCALQWVVMAALTAAWHCWLLHVPGGHKNAAFIPLADVRCSCLLGSIMFKA
jgi:predicted small integral membrane protein